MRTSKSKHQTSKQIPNSKSKIWEFEFRIYLACLSARQGFGNLKFEVIVS